MVNKKKRFYELRIQLIDGTIRTFTLPKDLTSAARKEQFPDVESMMLGRIINVPLGKYHYDKRTKRTKVKLSVGRILSIKAKMNSNHTGKLQRTRSQFKSLDGSTKEIFSFLKHDHDTVNRIRIYFAILYWKRVQRREKGRR